MENPSLRGGISQAIDQRITFPLFRNIYFSIALCFLAFKPLLLHINFLAGMAACQAAGIQANMQQERLLSRTTKNNFDFLIRKAARRHGVDPLLIKAVICEESGFNPQCLSRTGARGLMQIMPRTARWYHVRGWTQPEANIDLGTRYLKEQLVSFDNNLPLALAAYNAGPYMVRKYKNIPPFAETRRYVRRVLHTYHSYL
jgi:soluble lytic murein transglycosylase-like protein